VTRTIATHPRAVVLALIAAGLMLGLIAGSTVLSPKAASADGGTGVENVVVGFLKRYVGDLKDPWTDRRSRANRNR